MGTFMGYHDKRHTYPTKTVKAFRPMLSLAERHQKRMNAIGPVGTFIFVVGMAVWIVATLACA